MKDFKNFYIAQSTQSAPPSTTGKAGGMIDSGWVPLFQTLAWIIFWAFLIGFIHRNFNFQLGGLLSAFVNRVKQGSPVEVATFKIGAPPAVASQQVNTATSEGTQGISLSQNQSEKVLNYQQYSTGIAEEIYLLHAAEVFKNKQGNYQVKVWLEAYTDVDFNECKRVIYRLHETLNPQVIATEAKNNQFELWLNVWGEFTVIAYVERKSKEPLWLTRYLDLPGRPLD
jgi:hypothetical protein